LIYG
jgi:hypothetical protein